MPAIEVADWRIACGNCGNCRNRSPPFPQLRSLRLDDAQGACEGLTAFCCHRARAGPTQGVRPTLCALAHPPYGGKVLFCSAMTLAQYARERARGRVARCSNREHPSLDVPEQCCGLCLPTLTQRFGGMFIQFDGPTAGIAQPAGLGRPWKSLRDQYGVDPRGARKLCRLSAGDQCFGHQCFWRPIKRLAKPQWRRSHDLC